MKNCTLLFCSLFLSLKIVCGKGPIIKAINKYGNDLQLNGFFSFLLYSNCFVDLIYNLINKDCWGENSKLIHLVNR